MGAARPSPEVEALARELCACEGWDPDERIECAPGEVVFAEPSAATGRWTCLRWQAYAAAAERLSKQQADAWETF